MSINDDMAETIFPILKDKSTLENTFWHFLTIYRIGGVITIGFIPLTPSCIFNELHSEVRYVTTSQLQLRGMNGTIEIQ